MQNKLIKTQTIIYRLRVVNSVSQPIYNITACGLFQKNSIYTASNIRHWFSNDFPLLQNYHLKKIFFRSPHLKGQFSVHKLNANWTSSGFLILVKNCDYKVHYVLKVQRKCRPIVCCMCMDLPGAWNAYSFFQNNDIKLVPPRVCPFTLGRSQRGWERG